MFKKIFKKAKKSLIKKDKNEAKENEEVGLHNKETHPLSPDLDVNLRELKIVFDRASDFVITEFDIGSSIPIKAAMAHIDGMIDGVILNNNVLKTLMVEISKTPFKESVDIDNVFGMCWNHLLNVVEIKPTRDLIEATNSLLDGDTVLFFEGNSKAIIIDNKQFPDRTVSEPETESVVRGPRDGFIENIRTNIVLIRRRIKTSRLKIEDMKVGVLSKTTVSIAYIDGIVYDGLVDEIKQRLERIDTDYAASDGIIEGFIEDTPRTIFPLLRATERPDAVAAALAEGQAAIIVDTSPFVLLAPTTFPQFLNSPEDYYHNWVYGTFTRILRFIALNIALLLPSLYVAIVTFHQEMIPTPLLITIADTRAGVPFPAFVEAALMEITFEILREAGVRLPKQVGQAVSIVGALVIGDAAVSAGLVSPAMVIVVALTAIASFTIVNISGSNAIRMLRFPIIVLAGTLGLYGIMIALMAILIHLVSLRSFGIPYLSPFSPLSIGDLKDSFVLFPRWANNTRPRLWGYKEPIRQDKNQMPRPPKKGSGKNDRGGGK